MQKDFAQAEGITEALKELDTFQLVTKADFKAELRDCEKRVRNGTLAALIAQTVLVVALIEFLK